MPRNGDGCDFDLSRTTEAQRVGPKRFYTTPMGTSDLCEPIVIIFMTSSSASINFRRFRAIRRHPHTSPISAHDGRVKQIKEANTANLMHRKPTRVPG